MCSGPAGSPGEGHYVGGSGGGSLGRSSAGRPGAGLTSRGVGQAGSDRLTLKLYWGKPSVRNFFGEPVERSD
jgi:hypothetical protein